MPALADGPDEAEADEQAQAAAGEAEEGDVVQAEPVGASGGPRAEIEDGPGYVAVEDGVGDERLYG